MIKNKTPINGMYFTNADFPQWQDFFGNAVISTKQKKDCGGCKKCDIEGAKKSINFTFVVTEDCNLNCSYCYMKHKTRKKMTKEVARKAVDFMLDSRLIDGYFDTEYVEGVILEFIGGEPLLEIDLIDYTVEYFKVKAFLAGHSWATNYIISIATNGVLFESEKVQNFIRKNRGKVSIGITIDGNKELHDTCRVFHDGEGSYDIVESAVKRWINFEGNTTPQTKITLSPNNIGFLNAAIKNVWDLGIVQAFANCCYEEGWGVQHARTFYKELKGLAEYMLEHEIYKTRFTSLFDETIGGDLKSIENWCGGNGSMLAVNTDGKLYPCIRFMEYSMSTPGRPGQPVGNIYTGIQSDNEWLKKLKKIDMISQSDEKCRSCEIAGGCSLCTAYNYDKFGDPNVRATFICLMHQARVMANCYYWNKLFKKFGLNKVFKLNIKKDWALQIISEKEFLLLMKVSDKKGG